MLTSLLARCCDQVPYYIICAIVFRHGYVTGQWRSEHAMLTKSVKSVISVVLKHVARAKKIRAIGVIREQYQNGFTGLQ